MKRILFTIIAVSLCALSIPAQLLIDNQRRTGETILKNFSVSKGKISFTADTGGCTGKESFRIVVKKDESKKELIPHYILTVERTVPDNCKGLFPEGIKIEFDMKKDLNLTGSYTVSFTNRIHTGPGD